MRRLGPGAWAALLAPVLAGAIVGVPLQVAEPGMRLYAATSPGLVAGIAGLACAAVMAGVLGARWHADRVAATAATAALEGAAASAARDRLRFLARLDHELKNPLTAIRVGLVNLEQATGMRAGGDEGGTALASVSAQADRITRLVSDLRKLADLETQALEAAPVELPSLLAEVAEAIGDLPGASERSVRVTVPQAPWPLPPVEGDRDLLFVAVQNLAGNAVKFSAPGDTVEIRASEDGEGLLIEVADTGIGIPADEIGQVWEELARGRAARSLPGTGIGLALVRVITARHGGRVAIRSRQGQGTVVSLWLPLPAGPGAAPDVAGSRQRGDSPGKAVA